MSSLNSNVYSQDGKILPFEMDSLPEFFQKKSEIELNETLENKKQKLQELQTMISGDQILNRFNFENDLLVQYLRHSKYDVLRAFIHVQKYVAIRSKHSNLFKSMPDYYSDSKNFEQYFFPLPYRTADGCTILVDRPGQCDQRKMEYDDFFRTIMMVFIQLMRDPMTQINGFRVIHDFNGTSWRHFRFCTPRNLLLLLHATTDCIPARYKEIHLVNESFLLRAVWTVVSPFISPKIRNRIYFHSKVEELLDFFPRSVLPVEYGGELRDICMKNWLTKANRQHETNTIEGQPNYY